MQFGVDVSIIEIYRIARNRKIFRGTATSTLFYASQVWGYCSFRNRGKVPALLLKVAPLFLDTLKLHLAYVVKVMAINQKRIPKLVLSQIILYEGKCVQEWNNLASVCDFSLLVTPNEQPTSLKQKFNTLLINTSQIMYQQFINEAQSSQYRQYHSKMNHNLEDKAYFLARNSADRLSTIFKIRGELTNLNYMPHRPELSILCSLCNHKESERMCFTSSRYVRFKRDST